MRDAVFASDVHLSPDHPATTAAFLDFVDREVAGRAKRFYLLGDLFEYWVGDEDGDEPLGATIATRLHALVDDGTEVSFLVGNRDFLIGAAYAARAGMTLLPDPFAVTVGGLDLVLSHGDALCTDDVQYQQFRAMVRNPAWQQMVLAKPLAERRAMARGARSESEAAKGTKSMAIMDVNDDATCALLAAHPGAVLVHGHTHRPAHHLHKVAGVERQRYVLTDWDADATPPRGGGLSIEDGSIRVLRLPVTPAKAGA